MPARTGRRSGFALGAPSQFADHLALSIATGQILTLGGNQLHSNGNNGTFTGAIATQ